MNGSEVAVRLVIRPVGIPNSTFIIPLIPHFLLLQFFF